MSMCVYIHTYVHICVHFYMYKCRSAHARFYMYVGRGILTARPHVDICAYARDTCIYPVSICPSIYLSISRSLSCRIGFVSCLLLYEMNKHGKTHTHTYIHVYIHINTYILTCVYIYIYTNTHACMHHRQIGETLSDLPAQRPAECRS